MSAIDWLHGRFVHTRRVRVLASRLDDLIPANSSVLDLGCGDGRLAKLLQDRRPDLRLHGADVAVRPDAQIPVDRFDGVALPYASNAYDYVMFVDVLHHVEDPRPLLLEALRVARKGLIIKDHLAEGFLARPILHAMDRVGNCRHGVPVPAAYLTESEWQTLIEELELTVSEWHETLKLYPYPVDLVCGRRLHFLAKLDVRQENEGDARDG